MPLARGMANDVGWMQAVVQNQELIVDLVFPGRFRESSVLALLCVLAGLQRSYANLRSCACNYVSMQPEAYA